MAERIDGYLNATDFFEAAQGFLEADNGPPNNGYLRQHRLALGAYPVIAAVAVAQAITGTLYSDPDTFGAGTVDQGQTITGTVYTDADTFGSGTITVGAVTITGTVYTDTDAFGAGTATTGTVTAQPLSQRKFAVEKVMKRKLMLTEFE